MPSTRRFVEGVLLLVLSSVRRDSTKLFGGPISMGFDRLSKIATVFEDAYTLTNGEALSMAAMLSGVHPAILGPSPPKTLSSWFLARLRRENVFTACIDLEPMNPLASEFSIFAEPRPGTPPPGASGRGFSRAFSILRRGASRSETVEDPRYGLDEALRTLTKLLYDAKRSGKPFLIVARLWDSHVPYRAPQGMARRLPSPKPMPRKRVGDLRKRVRGPWIEFLGSRWGWRSSVEDIAKTYSASIAMEGSIINDLLNELISLGLENSVAMIVLSDHGESLGEHDVWFHHHGLYETNTRIPLALYVPGLSPRRVRGRVSTIDIAPTIARLLGIEIPRFAKRLSLLEAVEMGGVEDRTMLFVEYRAQRRVAVLVNDLKFVTPLGPDVVCRYCNTIHGGVEELYNVRRDPLEDYNIVDYSRDEARELRRIADELYREALKLRISHSLSRSLEA